jgi:hypothetical protein
MASNVTINVSPTPGFCVKSKVLQLNVTSTHAPVPISQGLKVFVNIAWSKDVPPPLDGIEKTSEVAAHSPRLDLENERDNPIPVFASEGRIDTDKGTSVTRSCVMQAIRAVAIRYPRRTLNSSSRHSLPHTFDAPEDHFVGLTL